MQWNRFDEFKKQEFSILQVNIYIQISFKVLTQHKLLLNTNKKTK